MTSDTSESGVESLIVRSLVDEAGYLPGKSGDFDKDHAVDLAKLIAFIEATQPQTAGAIGLAVDSPKRADFLHRLQGEIAKRGVVDVLRGGVKHGALSVDLFYGSSTPGNTKAEERFAANLFSVTRQLHYSKDAGRLSLDLCLFINGLPVATFELKNSLTKQTVADAVLQYQRDRDPKELLFQFGRCMVHFAVDDAEVRMCTKLDGAASWFLPFNKGYNDGAGNPPNAAGLKTDYLWKETLTKRGLTNIIENYAQITEEKDARGRVKRSQVFPRYHQLRVVGKLLADVASNGAGKRYLIQHSAGSGKSNSIAWTAHQLIGVQKDGKPVFDSVIVVTDRVNLDKQIKNTIKQFAQVASTVGHADASGDLRRFLREGQKFPFILDEIGDEHRGNKFAIIIDEAHSSQGGRTAAKMNMALSEQESEAETEEEYEDQINRIMETRRMLGNASYFAFTATPKNKTLEIFGEPDPQGEKVRHKPFDSYTMKQAIQEGFIMDVLADYTPVNSFYRLMKTIQDDPEFDSSKAAKKLRRYVESHDHAIRTKAEILVDHFHNKVHRKIGGRARAMVVCSGIARAIQYWQAISDYLKERKSVYKAIIAFSGEQVLADGRKVTEATLNEFPGNKIESTFKEDPYRFLVVANKFQTGYDEPLLHTMYVDKQLAGITAVQTLSRLNRAHPQKTDTFVLDFMNDTDTVVKSFADFYRTTILSDEADENKLHDLKASLDQAQVYSLPQVEQLSRLFVGGADRDQLDPILDACVVVYLTSLDEDGQVDFKGKAKAFVRAYQFLASVLPYTKREWEELSTFLNFLIPKLPAPKEEDLSKGVLESIDMESYRSEVRDAMRLTLPDENAEIDPMPMGGGGGKPEPELDRLSNIIKSFNDQFGNIDWKDADRIRQVIAQEIPGKVAADEAYQNAMKNSDKAAARLEHDRALQKVVIGMLTDHTELFKQFSDNPSFRKWLADTVFNTTYDTGQSQTAP
jgi:type I restriction enzyme R subunit